MLLLAGLVLAIALVTVSVVVSTQVHTPARLADTQRPIALTDYEDFRANTREALSFLLGSVGITEPALHGELERLNDAGRLGVSGRDVRAFLVLNGSRERALCEEDPPYGSIGLDGIARRSDGLTGPAPCPDPGDADGILKDGRGTIVAVAVDAGIVGSRYRVQETMVVVQPRNIVYLRQLTNVTVGATVDDPPIATDFPDGRVHELKGARSNVPTIRGYAAVPHPVYSGEETGDASRAANWSVVVANPTGRSVVVDRIEVFTAGVILQRAVGPMEPQGWSIEEDEDPGDAVTRILNGDFQSDVDDGLEHWSWERTPQVGEVDPQLEVVEGDADGCAKLGATNACVRYRTRDDVERNASVELWQAFAAPPETARAELTFKYQTATDGTASNDLRVTVVDDAGTVVHSWRPSDDPGTPVDATDLTGWYEVTRDLGAKLVPEEEYEVHLNVTQELDPLLGNTVEATAWFDDVQVTFTPTTQKLVWEPFGADDPVTVPPNASRAFRTGVKVAEFLGSAETYDFQVSVRDGSGAGARWFNHTNPAYNTTRGPLQPTATVALDGDPGPGYEATWNRTSASGTTETWRLVVEESSNVVDLPRHELTVRLPLDWTFRDVDSEDCGSSACYQLAGTEELATGTRVRLQSTGSIPAGEERAVELTVTPPGVGRTTLYRAELRLSPTSATDHVWAAGDVVLTVAPDDVSKRTIDVVYVSEPVTQKVDVADIKALRLRLDLAASGHLPVKVQVFNATADDPANWTWRDLGVAGVDAQVSTLRYRLKHANATAMGILDAEGAKALNAGTPPRDGTAEPGQVALRVFTERQGAFRLHVDVAIFRIEYV